MISSCVICIILSFIVHLPFSFTYKIVFVCRGNIWLVFLDTRFSAVVC